MYRTNRFLARLVISSICILLPVSACYAQATRTWVSGVGDDANPCSRTAPCKTFAGAISKTAAKGVISVLDPGGFGAVTITKAITIESPENWGGILSALTNGVIVNAGANDVVALRGLSIDGTGTGINGVRFLGGAKLVMDNCYIAGVSGSGIDFEPAGASKFVVSNTTISDSTANAVLVQAGASGSATGTLDNVRLTNSGFGLRVNKGVVAVKGSIVSGNTTTGVKAFGTSDTARIMLADTVVSDTTVGTGVSAQGAQASVFMATTTVTNNSLGVSGSNGGSVSSFGNNRIAGNTTDGNPTLTVNER